MLHIKKIVLLFLFTGIIGAGFAQNANTMITITFSLFQAAAPLENSPSE